MGLALLWKPAGLESQRGALGALKRALSDETGARNRHDIGHSGTLDPFAEGQLLCAWGEGTKLLAPLTGLSKTYEVGLVLGATTPSLDPQSALEFFDVDLSVDDAHLEKFLARQLGPGTQIPPQLSALRIDGKRAYEWARAGVEKEMKPRAFEIFKVKHQGVERQSLEGHETLLWRFTLTVSSGTYIRSLARDFGQALVGAPGHLRRLVRTAIGPFEARQKPLSPLQLSDLAPLFDRIPLSEVEARRLRENGQWAGLANLGPRTKPLLCVGPNEDVIAWVEPEGPRLGRVFRENPLSLGPRSFQSLVDRLGFFDYV